MPTIDCLDRPAKVNAPQQTLAPLSGEFARYEKLVVFAGVDRRAPGETGHRHHLAREHAAGGVRAVEPRARPDTHPHLNGY